MNNINYISTGIGIFASAVLSLMVLEIGIRNAHKYGKEKKIRKTVMLRYLAFFSSLSLVISSFLMLLRHWKELDVLIDYSLTFIFIGLVLFTISLYLIFIYSRRQRWK